MPPAATVNTLDRSMPGTLDQAVPANVKRSIKVRRAALIYS